MKIIKAARPFLFVVSALNALAGLICGVLLIAAPDGSLMAAGELLPVVATFPLAYLFFQDLRWIGIAMLLVLWIPNELAVLALWFKHRLQYTVVVITNIAMMLWCTFQFIFMFNWLAVVYFVLGALMVIAAIYLSRRADVDSSGHSPPSLKSREGY